MDVATPGQIVVNRTQASALPRFFIASPHWWVREALSGLIKSHYPAAQLASANQPPARPNGGTPLILITDAPATAAHETDLVIFLGDGGVPHWQEDERTLLASIDAALQQSSRDAGRAQAGAPRASRASPGGLTRRQQDVLACLALGQSNASIAKALGMSENTVRIHVSAILKTLGLSNRTQAALWANSRPGATIQY